jgi:UDP-glucose 4-epimerase
MSATAKSPAKAKSPDTAHSPGCALVTGGAGFIGGHLVERLVSDGWQVRVLDDFSSGRASNLSACEGRFELHRGDLTDVDLLDRAVSGTDVIFHEGAIASVPQSIDDPERTHHVNTTGTLRVLQAARRHGVRRVVFAASSAAYGNDETLPKREDQRPDILSPYAAQKYASELYLGLFHDLYGLETVALRYFNVYGPRQDPKSDYAAVIPLFIAAALREKTLRIHGDGEQTRDFVYVDDVVEANLLAAGAPGVGGVYNVASGRRTSVNDLVRVISSCVGREVDVKFEDERAGDVRHSWADIDRTRAALGFTPSVDLQTGLERTVDAFRGDLG